MAAGSEYNTIIISIIIIIIIITNSGVIAGIEYVASQHQTTGRQSIIK